MRHAKTTLAPQRRFRTVLAAVLLPTLAAAQQPASQTPDQAAHLIQELRDHYRDPQASRRAIRALIDLGQAAVPTLQQALHDENQFVRLHASVALGGMGEPLLPVIIQAMRNDDRHVRENLASALWKIGPAVIPHLKKALTDTDDRVREGVARTLEKIGPHAEPALPELTAALADPNARVRTTAVRALSRLGEAASPAVPALIEALADADHTVRMSAASTLAEVGPPARSAVPALVQALKDPASPVRVNAATALGRIGIRTGETTAALLQTLHDNDGLVRKHIAKVLTGLTPHAGAAAPVLARALADENAYVREIVASALGQLGEGAAVALPALTERLAGDETDRVLVLTATALQRIGPEAASATAALLPLLDSDNPELRGHATFALQAIGTGARQAVPALTRMAEQGPPIDRLNATVALAGIAGEPARAVPGLVQALGAEDRRLRRHAAMQLLELGPAAEEAAPALGTALMDPDRGVRWYASQALNALDPQGTLVVAALKDRLESDQPADRRRAVQRLGEAGPAAIEPLLRALHDPDGDVRRQAIKACGRIGPGAAAAVPALVAILETDARATKRDTGLRPAAAQTLGKIGPQAAAALPALLACLRDDHRVLEVRATTALWQIQPDRPWTASRPGADGAAPPDPSASPAAGTITLRDGLVIGAVGRGGRRAVHTDAIEAAIVTGQWSPPSPGDSVTLPGGTTPTWQPASADGDGWFQQPTQAGLRGGYLYLPVDLPARRVMLLEARGHGRAYVNGVPRTGDPYGNGLARLPVQLEPGVNHLLLRCGRRPVQARLVPPGSPLLLDTRDATLPDLRVGERLDAWGAVVLINAAADQAGGFVLEVSGDDLETTRSPVPALPPLSIRKVGFRLVAPAPATSGDKTVTLRVLRPRDGDPEQLATAAVQLHARRPEESYKTTFLSRIDGSVQYYAVTPAGTAPPGAGRPALFLSLHGAGVEATNQARSYAPKSWGHLVAPTNRRPFGFDWEDWGRLDAMEVLDHALHRLNADPQLVYLTGHSMGGHGVWNLGATFPDRFAALGPSAGWISFWSYSSRRESADDPVAALIQRAAAGSDTLAFASNYAHHGIYLLHGADDDNVPAEQARTMREHLEGFHRDFAWHEQPGAGHWWNVSDEPGADCVDWAPMFDLFARHRIPTADSIRQVSFTTVNPGVSAWCHWVGIEAQQRLLEPASVDLRCDPLSRRFAGTTDNVARLSLRVEHLEAGPPLSIHLDGQQIDDIPWPGRGAQLWCRRTGDGWSVCQAPPPAWKGPHRYGLFKDAFRNRVLFVYGTAGGEEHNAWTLAKARYDAETLWYRGNASVDVVADTEFDPAVHRDRNVILYGNAETNRAWPALLGESPVDVRSGAVQVGSRRISGDDLACLFIRPRPGSESASVGVVSGSGLAGMRLTDGLRYFLSGVAYPDCIVLGTDTLTSGRAGVRVAGFFGLDWTVENGEFAWRE